MKKSYKFFRGITLLLCCLGSAAMFSQTYTDNANVPTQNGQSGTLLTCGTAFELNRTQNVGIVNPGNVLNEVTINLLHTFDADLEIYLMGPNGTEIELTTDNGGSGDNYTNTRFRIDATNVIGSTGNTTAPFNGIYAPEGSFGALASGLQVGNWTLRLCDDAGGDTGTLQNWSLTFGPLGPPPPMYCTSVPTSNDGLGISNLTLGTTAFVIPDVTYSNQTATAVTVQQGLTVNTQITFRTGYTYDTHIWVDFNDNAVFEASERVYTGVSTSANPTTLNASFTLPASAPIGAHRLRIGTADTGQGIPNPCYNGSYGVTIDATLNVIAPLCTSAVVSSSVISPDCSNNRYFINVNVTTVGDATTFSNGQAVVAGVNAVGPFVNGATVNLAVNHSEAACNFNVGSFTYNCPPANDTCGTAEQVICGEVKTGTTQFANSETLQFCGTSLSSAAGVWYKLEGTGGDIVVSTADSAYDTKLGVFSGACSALVCVGGNDDFGGTLQSQVTFTSTAGATYYVYVTGFGTARGAYNLSVQCVCEASISDDCATVFSGYAPSSSTTLTAVGQFGLAPYTYLLSDGQTNSTGVFTVSPSATTVYEVTITDAAGCMSTADTTVVVVDVQCSSGNGNNDAKVIVCHNGSEICISPNAVQAHLNHGDLLGPCGSATCETPPVCDARLKVPGPGATDVPTDIVLAWGAATGYAAGYRISIGTSSGGTDVVNNLDVGNTLTYDPNPDLNFGTTYYVTIVAYNSNGTATGGCQESSFTTEQSPWCASASIGCNSTTTGNTALNGELTPLSFCGTSLNTSPGVWYQFVGTGDEIILTTCNPGTDYDTKIGVFTSPDCTALTCVGGNDDQPFGTGTDPACVVSETGSSSNRASTVEFTSAAGTTYYIYVTGFSTNSGNFEMTLTCGTPPPPPAACVSAIGVSCNSTTTGSTVGFDVNDLAACGTNLNSAPGRFYKVEGTGSNITVDTCGSAFDTKLGVFSGSCAGLVCVGGNDDNSVCNGGSFSVQSSVTFASQAGTIYYIYVTGFGSGQGNFNLNVSCGAPRVAADPLTWNMYPNPATRGEVQLDLSNFLDQDLGIQLMDFSGKLLRDDSIINLQNPRYSIKTQTMSNGLYFVRVVTESGVSTKKLIIAN